MREEMKKWETERPQDGKGTKESHLLCVESLANESKLQVV